MIGIGLALPVAVKRVVGIALEAMIVGQVDPQFTSADSRTGDEMGYLLSALRGGIFNQGGPAIGELGRSERNRSRAAMDMRHVMIMSSPN